LNKGNQTFLNQDNNANIKNDVDAKAKTGNNDASYNTGGDSIIVTGNATTNVGVQNKANANFATIGGGNGGAGGSSVRVTGNGAFSDNNVNLDNASAIVLDQSNNARIRMISMQKLTQAKTVKLSTPAVKTQLRPAMQTQT